MAKLKTDFKDWKADANGLQYKIGTTSLGNSSITDVTTYTQQGNEWQASILNSTNTEVNALMDTTDSLGGRIDDVNSSLTTNIDGVNTSLTTKININYDTLSNLVTTSYDALNFKIDTSNAAQDINILELFDRVNKVRDPTTGLLSPIQVVVNNLFALHVVGAITAGEFDDLQIAAGDFDDMQISAFDFDTRARTILIGGI